MKVSFKHDRNEALAEEFVQIEIYDKREKVSENVMVKKLTGIKFQVAENAVMLCHLTIGTEFETRINKDGQHEITKITKESEFITRRFFLNGKFTEEEYRVLGDEIMKQGGYWQVDMGSLATINLPKNATLDLDEIFRIFEFYPAEIKEEDL